MSHYVMNYHDEWTALRKQVKAARDTYLKTMERLEPYSDSAQGQKDMEDAKADYEAALEAARGAARPKFDRIIKGMEERVASPDMTAPTPEMLATLQMLDMRDSIESEEVEAAAKVMGNNSAALKTLGQIVQRHGSIMPLGFKTPDAQARDAVAKLRDAANNLLQWDGRSGMEISSDASAAYHEFRWGGGAPVPANARVAQWVADIEPRSFYKDTARAIVGDGISAAVIDALE